MFKLFHKFYSSFIFTQPSVHYIQPKSLNVYFKNAIKPKYQLLNLAKYNHLSIDTIQEKDGENSVFTLRLILNTQSEIETISLASFETRRESEDALNILKNKLFSPEKTWFKLIITSATIAFIFLFILAFLQNNVGSKDANVQTSNASNVNQINPLVLQKLQEQAKLANQVNSQVNSNIPPVVANSPAEQTASQNTQDSQVQAYKQLQSARELAMQQARAEGNKLIQDNAKQMSSPTAEERKSSPPIVVNQDPAIKDLMSGLSK